MIIDRNYKNPWHKKAKKEELPRNHVQTHIQVDLRVPHPKICFSFKLAVFFPPFLKTMLYFRISQKIA